MAYLKIFPINKEFLKALNNKTSLKFSPTTSSCRHLKKHSCISLSIYRSPSSMTTTKLYKSYFHLCTNQNCLPISSTILSDWENITVTIRTLVNETNLHYPFLLQHFIKCFHDKFCFNNIFSWYMVLIYFSLATKL